MQIKLICRFVTILIIILSINMAFAVNIDWVYPKPNGHKIIAMDFYGDSLAVGLQELSTFIFSKNLGNTWEVYFVPFSNNFKSVVFSNDTSILFFGNTGSIFKYLTVSKTWVSLSPVTQEDLNVSASTSQKIYVGGNNSTFLEYNKSLDKFNAISGLSLGAISKIDIVEDSIIWVKNYPNQLFVSYDGGHNWLQSNIIASQFVDFDMVTKDTGYAAIGNGIYYTEDAGVHWDKTPYIAPNNYALSQIVFFTTLKGIAETQDYPAPQITTDGGRNWKSFNPILNPSNSSMGRFVFYRKDSITAFVAPIISRYSVYRTINSGSSWNISPTYSPPEMHDMDRPLYVFAKPNDSDIYLVNHDHFISHDDCVTWSLFMSRLPYDGGIWQAHFINNNVGWDTGVTTSVWQPTTYFSSNGGQSWSLWGNRFGFQRIDSLKVDYPHFFLPIDSLVIFSNDRHRSLYRTRNQGFTWQEILPPCGSKQLFYDNNKLWLNSYSLLYTSTNLGDTWDTLSLGALSNCDISVVNGYVWLIKNFAYYLRRPDSNDWQAMFQGNLNTAIFLDSNTVIATVQDTLIISHDFGNSWNASYIPGLHTYTQNFIKPWLFLSNVNEVYRINYRAILDFPYTLKPPTKIIEQPLLFERESNIFKFSINASGGIFQISFDPKNLVSDASISIYTMNGRLVAKSTDLIKGNVRFNLQRLSNGSYFVVMKNGSVLFTRKLIIIR